MTSLSLRTLNGHYDAREFGSLTSGQAAATINAALVQANADGGGVVELPTDAGSLWITSPILMQTNTELLIPYGVTLKLVAVIDTYVLSNADRVNGNTNFRIRGGGTIHGNRANQNGYNTLVPVGLGGAVDCAIYLENCSDFLIEGLTLQSCYLDGLNLTSCARAEVRGIIATDNGRDGIRLSTTTYSVLAHCRSHDNSKVSAAGTGDGVHLNSTSTDNLLIGCVAYDTAGASGRQGYGVREEASSSCNRNMVVGGSLNANRTGGTSFIGAASGVVGADIEAAVVPNGLTVTASGLTVTAGGLTVTAGGLTVTAGGLTVTAGGLTASGTVSDIGGVVTGSRFLVGALPGLGGSMPTAIAQTSTTDQLNQFGVLLAPIMKNTSGVGGLRGVYVYPTVGLASDTDAYAYVHALSIASPVVNTSGGILNAVGLNVAAVTAGATNNYGIEVGTPSGGSTNNYGIYVVGGSPAIYIAAGGLTVAAGGLTVSAGVVSLTPTPANIASGASAVCQAIYVPATTVTVTGTTQITTATGFNLIEIAAPTYTDASAVTVNQGATLYIAAAPTAGGSVTLTNPYALWVDAGMTRLDGGVTINAANIVTDTTTGMRIGTAGGASGQKLGFFNATPIVQPLLATGAAHTVDDVITTLQNLGLVRQT